MASLSHCSKPQNVFSPLLNQIPALCRTEVRMPPSADRLGVLTALQCATCMCTPHPPIHMHIRRCEYVPMLKFIYKLNTLVDKTVTYSVSGTCHVLLNQCRAKTTSESDEEFELYRLALTSCNMTGSRDWKVKGDGTPCA